MRRKNLQRFVDRYMKGNFSELARKYAQHMGGRPPRATFFSDVMRGAKGFGETLAENVEAAVRLKSGQLSVQDSPLELLEPIKKKPAEQLTAALDSLEDHEALEVVDFIEQLKARRKPRRRATR